MTAIVFLHVPKTAGQTVHNEIARVVGPKKTSPIRVHTQAKGADQYPQGHSFYSGHLDWRHMQNVPDDRFVFSVLRDPRERIASFYFFMLRESQKLSDEQMELPQFTGQRTIRTQSADDYFFGGSPKWQRFVHDTYNNFYTAFFATRMMRGWQTIADDPTDEVMARAIRGAGTIDAIYSVESLSILEDDLLPILGQRIAIAERRHNTGPQPVGEARWPRLMERFERSSSAAKLETFVSLDLALMEQITIR